MVNQTIHLTFNLIILNQVPYVRSFLIALMVSGEFSLCESHKWKIIMDIMTNETGHWVCFSFCYYS